MAGDDAKKVSIILKCNCLICCKKPVVSSSIRTLLGIATSEQIGQ